MKLPKTDFPKAKRAAIAVSKKIHKDLNVDTKKIYVRLNERQYYDAIIVVPVRKFVSKRFLTAYSIVNHVKEKVNTKKFDIRIIFMANSKNINEKLLCADGYVHKYKDNKWGLVNG
jgi:hypothetical protein